MVDQNEMEKIVTPMMEHLCDHLCRFPWEVERKEDLEDICAECRMDRYTNDILNTYNRDNDWISVSERLPETGKRVIITSLEGEVDVDFLESSGEWFFGIEGYTVIAWRPLPEPYQSEQTCKSDWKRHLMERFGRCE